MLDSFLAQVRVSGGFPVHTQVKVTSEPISVVRGFGSTTMRGATGRGEQGKRCYRSDPSSLKGPRGHQGPRWRSEALGLKVQAGGVHFPSPVSALAAMPPPLTMDVHQGADVSTAHVVAHFTRDGLCEEGVIHLRLVFALLGVLNNRSTFGPPGRIGEELSHQVKHWGSQRNLHARAGEGPEVHHSHLVSA